MDIAGYYEKRWAGKGYQIEGNVHSEWQRSYIKTQFPCTGKTILDIGCGNGRIGSLFSTDNTVVGIDVSLAAVDAARSKGLSGLVGSIDGRLPFKDETFDVILLIEVIEHVFDPVSLVNEIYRVLRNGGRVICTVPNASIILNRLYFLFFGEFKDFTAQDNVLSEGFPFTEHLHLFSPALIKKVFIRNGFTIADIRYWFPSQFIHPPFNRLNWIATLVNTLHLFRLLPDVFAVGVFLSAKK